MNHHASNDGRYTKGTIPFGQSQNYKGDAHYARLFKWPTRFAKASFWICVGIYMARHWL